MALELLVGVFHLERYTDIVDDFIRKRYPNGPASMMIELPPHKYFSRFVCGFYVELKKRYEDKTKIIYGDKNYPMSEKEWRDLDRVADRIDLRPNLTDLVVMFQKLLHQGFVMYDVIFNRETGYKRNLGMKETIEDEQPQVIVVGRNHANFLKKSFPKVHYVAFAFPEENGLLFKIAKKPYKPDEVIMLPQRKFRKFQTPTNF